MKVSSEHRAELSFEIPQGVHVESRYEPGDGTEKDLGRRVLKIWSDSDVSPADAVTKIIQMSDSLVAALKETK